MTSRGTFFFAMGAFERFEAYVPSRQEVILFLSALCIILTLVASVIVMAVMRARRDLRTGRAEKIRWSRDFRDLPEAFRRCRHELTGEIERRTCPTGFDCRSCADHPRFLRASDMVANGSDGRAIAATSIQGFKMPPGRMYHRGHTWAQPRQDGTLAVGLDDLAARLMEPPLEVMLPGRGTRLTVNGIGWRVRTGDVTLRVLSPVEGEVIDTGGPTLGWYLLVRPAGDGVDARHLLAGWEARAWMLCELERLQMMTGGTMGQNLADGGIPIRDLAAAIPQADRLAILQAMLLQP